MTEPLRRLLHDLADDAPTTVDARAVKQHGRRRRAAALAGGTAVVVAAFSVGALVLTDPDATDELVTGPAAPTTVPAPAPSQGGAPTVDPGPPPRTFLTRPTLPDCGTHDIGGGAGDGVPAEARQCLADGARNGRGAELAERQQTTEGDPIVTYTRALPNGSGEVFRDTTADKFGDQVWTLSSCAAISSDGRAERCGTPEILLGADAGRGQCPDGDTSSADYATFVRVGGETYVLGAEAPATTRLGVTVLEVHCDLSQGARRAGDRLQSGDAAHVPVGTPVRQTLGFDPRFRLAVETGGRVRLLERATPSSPGSSYRVAFPGVVDRIRGVVLLDRDKATELGRVDAAGVPRIRQALAVGYYAPGSATKADRFLRLELDDGSVVTRAYDSESGIVFPGVTLTSEARAALQSASG